jgi:ribonuclease D
MNNSPLQPAIYIRTDKNLRQLAAALAQEPLIAVDTESNSLYAYRERVCLIQLSTRTADYIIDPLEELDLNPLAPVFENEKIEKVFHAAEYDLMTMKRDFGFRFHNLFDTMVAARICGYKSIGLGTLLAEILGIDVDKSHQRDNWGIRPLPKASLLYAQLDTHYLPQLRHFFYARLTELDRWEEAREAFEELANVVSASANGFDPEGYWRIALPNHLTRRQAAILREVYLLREDLARQRDVPTFKVFTDKMLTAVAIAAPSTVAELEAVEGFPTSQARRYSKPLLAAVQRGIEGKLPQPPPLEPPADPNVVERYTALREWRKERAALRGVESDVIISKDALWMLAERAPTSLDEMRDVRGIGTWRLQQYGDELLKVIKRYT